MVNKTQILEIKRQIFSLRYAAKHAEATLPLKLAEIQREREKLHQLEKQAYEDKENAPILRLRADYMEYRMRSMLVELAPTLTKREKLERKLRRITEKLKELKQELPDEFFTTESTQSDAETTDTNSDTSD